MAIDPKEVERRAKRAFEEGRARAALVVASPLLGAGLGAAALSSLSTRAIVLSVLAYCFVAYLWWRGREHAGAIAPGVLAGTSLLMATFVAHGFGGHVCNLEECVTQCAPIGAAGGLGSGVVLGLSAARAPGLRRRRWWIEASALAGLFGSVGCSCIGFVGGFAGLGTMALVATPVALLLRRPA